MKEGSMQHLSLSKSIILFFFALLLTISCQFSAAQTAAPATTANPSQTTAPVPAGPPVLAAKITASLSSKTARAGDPVTAKTITTLKLGDGVEIPRGSRIVGSVASVKSAQDGGGTSSLAVKIDQVEMKDGKFMRIAGQIVAIGPLPDSAVGLGYDSVLGRGGVGSSVGLDPSVGAGPAVNRGDPDIPRGSTLEGIKLNGHLNTDRATEMRGTKRDIKLDSTVMIKIALFRPSGA
jgi:hypothetical protein